MPSLTEELRTDWSYPFAKSVEIPFKVMKILSKMLTLLICRWSWLFVKSSESFFQDEIQMSLKHCFTFDLFSVSRLLPTIAHWMLSSPKNGTTTTDFLTEGGFWFFLFFSKSTSCKWLLQQRCSLVHAYPLCMVLKWKSVYWSLDLSCIINIKSFLFNLVGLNYCYWNKE